MNPQSKIKEEEKEFFVHKVQEMSSKNEKKKINSKKNGKIFDRKFNTTILFPPQTKMTSQEREKKKGGGEIVQPGFDPGTSCVLSRHSSD